MFEGLEEEGERKREREKWEGKNREGGWRGEWRIGKGIGDRKWGGRGEMNRNLMEEVKWKKEVKNKRKNGNLLVFKHTLTLY